MYVFTMYVCLCMCLLCIFVYNICAVCMYVCMYVYCLCMYICMYYLLYCMYVSLYVCMYVCMTGKYLWHEGNSYEGDFAMDERDGFGVYRWADGSMYEGQFGNCMRYAHSYAHTHVCMCVYVLSCML